MQVKRVMRFIGNRAEPEKELFDRPESFLKPMPSVGDSLVQIQERYNTLSNIQAETYEYGIPPIYADPQVLDFDTLAKEPVTVKK